MVQRIDKTYTLGNFWNFARPNLDPVDVSIVVHGGSAGYGCYVKGNEHIFNDPSSAFGYTDGKYIGVNYPVDVIDLINICFFRVSCRCPGARCSSTIAKITPSAASQLSVHISRKHYLSRDWAISGCDR